MSRGRRAHLADIRPAAAEARHAAASTADDVTESQTLNARRFAFSIIVNGGCIDQTSEIFLWNNLHIPARSTVYRAQAEFFDIISQMCEESCAKYRATITKPTVLSFDGAWSHRRNAKESILTFIDCQQKKIVDYCILTQAKSGIPGNCDCHSNGMEVEALRRLIPRWVGDDRVTGVVHDNDSAATDLIAKSEWKVEQYYDPNHVVKALERCWAKMPHGNLRGVWPRLLKFFQWLIRADMDAEVKEAYWKNSLEHFKGNHQQCPREHVGPIGPPLVRTREAEKELRAFLEKSAKYVTRVRNGFDQQMNESFNGLKAVYAPKSRSWKVTWRFRTQCAILQMNSTDQDWRLALAERCGIQLPAATIDAIRKRWRQRQKINEDRRTQSYQFKESARRRKAVAVQGENRTGVSDYYPRPRTVVPLSHARTRFAGLQAIERETAPVSGEHEPAMVQNLVPPPRVAFPVPEISREFVVPVPSTAPEVRDDDPAAAEFARARAELFRSPPLQKSELLPFFDLDLDDDRHGPVHPYHGPRFGRQLGWEADEYGDGDGNPVVVDTVDGGVIGLDDEVDPDGDNPDPLPDIPINDATFTVEWQRPNPGGRRTMVLRCIVPHT
jgi:hypothetical protein